MKIIQHADALKIREHEFCDHTGPKLNISKLKSHIQK